MSWTTTINGVSYTAPDVGENFWGTQVKNWMQAVGGTGSGQGGMLKKDGGLFQLLSEVNFGTNFGIKSLTYTSGSANSGAAAGAGQIRLKRADTVQWRNNADSANLTLGVSTSNWIQWQSVDLADISSAQTFTNKTISGASNTLTNISLGSLVAPSAGTIYSDGASILSEARLSLSRMAAGTQYYVLMGNGASSPTYQTITNNSVDAAAAIARSKLASGSASHVVINDGSGVMSSEARLSLARTADGTANYVLIAAGVGSSPAYGLISNASIDAAAAIARTKIAAGSANHVIINDGAGNLSSEAQLNVSRGGTGLSAVGTSNQVLGVNNAGNAYEFKTESVGTAGTDFAISHSASSIVFNLPNASSVNRGALTSADWSTFNSKIGGSGTNGQVALFDGTGTITSSSSIAYSTSANSNTLSLLSGIKIGMNTTLANVAGVGSIRYNSGVLEYSDGVTWNTLGVSGAGILTLNSLNATAQTMVVGTSGTDFAINSASSTHTFNLPDAGASARGVVTTGTQTFAGAKTFSGNVILNGTVTLGDATADDITFNGYVASAILPKTSGSFSLGSTSQNWDAVYLDKDATNGGSVYFNAGTTSYLQSNAAGTILTVGGFTSMVPPAAINAAGALTIGTNGSTAAITIDTSQLVGIGNTTPGSFNAAAKNLVVGTGSGNNGITIYSGSTSQSALSFAYGTTTTEAYDAYIGYSHSSKVMTFYTNLGTAALQINSSQSVVPQKLLDLSTATAGQIKFPASQNASADANTLDDYEEGTWSPGLTFGGGSTGLTFSASRAGYYTKIGNMVYCTGFIQLTNKGSSTGAANLTGLPFTITNSSAAYSSLSVGYFANMSGLTSVVCGYGTVNNTSIVLLTGGTGAVAAISDTNFSNSTEFMISFFYRA